jgi:RimJ/RimL family protein N-acetyltransferase
VWCGAGAGAHLSAGRYPVPARRDTFPGGSRRSPTRAYVYVFEHDEGRILGFATTRGNELLHFGAAVVTWGTGLAAAGHDQIMERLAASGVANARLRVFEDSHRARRFYEKLG